MPTLLAIALLLAQANPSGEPSAVQIHGSVDVAVFPAGRDAAGNPRPSTTQTLAIASAVATF